MTTITHTICYSGKVTLGRLGLRGNSIGISLTLSKVRIQFNRHQLIVNQSVKIAQRTETRQWCPYTETSIRMRGGKLRRVETLWFCFWLILSIIRLKGGHEGKGNWLCYQLFYLPLMSQENDLKTAPNHSSHWAMTMDNRMKWKGFSDWYKTCNINIQHGSS